MATVNAAEVKQVVVACDAGMGSSVLLTSQLAKRFKPLGVSVAHSQVDSVPPDAKVIVCHEALVARAQGAAPGAAVVPFKMFMGDPAFDRLEDALRNGETLS
jgi:mannitol-specific phosphotransferase system IIBC component